jgi:type II secretory pathway pseudopilin PulG
MRFNKLTNHSKYLPALSLVEVLVVLGLVSVSMVGIAGINVRSQIAVKDNELIDAANGIMLQALELAKSPTQLKISSTDNTTNINGTYAIDKTQPDTLLERPSSDAILTSTSTCNTASPYFVSVSSTNPPLICLQITFERKQRPLVNDNYYEVTSRVLFKLSRGPVLNQLVAYRRGEVK